MNTNASMTIMKIIRLFCSFIFWSVKSVLMLPLYFYLNKSMPVLLVSPLIEGFLHSSNDSFTLLIDLINSSTALIIYILYMGACSYDGSIAA